MTFRGKLRFFLAILVIVPTAALGAVLLSLSQDSERGKADARLATAFNVARVQYAEARAAAAGDLRRIAADAPLTGALRARDRVAAAARLESLVRNNPAVASATLFTPSGEVMIRAGSAAGVAPAAAGITRPGGARVGTLAVSVIDARELVGSVARRTGVDALVLRDGRSLASSVPGVTGAPTEAGDFEAGGEAYRGRRTSVGVVAGRREELAVFSSADEINATIAEHRLLIALTAALFLGFALAGALLLGRALQRQVAEFLHAARRLAAGRFDEPLAVEGNDEFSQLASEFNSMSVQLEAQIREVERKGRELEGTIRRVGQAFASGLNSQAAFDLAIQTAVDACQAEFGHGRALEARLVHDTSAGSPVGELLSTLETAERRVLAGEGGGRSGPVTVHQQGGHALALPLYAPGIGRPEDDCVALLSIARRDRPFTPEETEMAQYLAAQAVVSIENADLHERVQLDSVTDELTGLSNLRRMQVALTNELERARRFDTSVGFVLLDIDNFKKVNDTYGHQQGDEVLRQVAGVLRALSREIDEPARYGGEELAVVAPETPLEGAARLAERIRSGIEDLRIPRIDGEGEISVSASFGVASAPDSALDEESLIAAADAALYRAKRLGKNRVEVAEPVPVAP